MTGTNAASAGPCGEPTRSAVRKWSVEINGLPSSVSLEAEFYAGIERMARARGITTQMLIGEVAEHKPQRNLSSELRLTVLRELQKRLYG